MFVRIRTVYRCDICGKEVIGEIYNSWEDTFRKHSEDCLQLQYDSKDVEMVKEDDLIWFCEDCRKVYSVKDEAIECCKGNISLY